jgi:predicted aminopeptidase
MIGLGHHPEVLLCFRCAHFVHQQARAREDAAAPSLAARGRDVVRAGRTVVMRHGWQHNPVIGPVLRWLGPRLP